MSRARGRLVILTGPSCVGKTPLVRALRRFCPDEAGGLVSLVLYNSRAPRPGEVDGIDYHFRPRDHIEALRGDPRFAILDVRGDLQALDVEDLSSRVRVGHALFEGNPLVGRLLQALPLPGVNRLGIFVSPISREEIAILRADGRVSLPEIVCDLMRRKLLRRTRRMKGELSLADLQEVERRAASAYRELAEAFRFDHVVPNHDGEDSDNWEAFPYPLGDARRTLLAVEGLLRGDVMPGVERWDEGVIAAPEGDGPYAGASGATPARGAPAPAARRRREKRSRAR